MAGGKGTTLGTLGNLGEESCQASVAVLKHHHQKQLRGLVWLMVPES